jgi:acyl carrier protein
MTQQEIFDALVPLVREVTGARPDRIRMTSVLMEDLGAESLDLLDLTFLIEERFGITIEANEFERRARACIPDGVYERDGFLTDAALAELRRALPEVSAGRLVSGLRKVELPALLPVSVFVRLIETKLAQQARGEHDT